MLVNFIDKENPTIILEKEYKDVLVLMEMIKQKATINIFLDSSGNKRVNGRLYDYEYTISIDNETMDSLLVYIDTRFNNITKHDN